MRCYTRGKHMAPDKATQINLILILDDREHEELKDENRLRRREHFRTSAHRASVCPLDIRPINCNKVTTKDSMKLGNA